MQQDKESNPRVELSHIFFEESSPGIQNVFVALEPSRFIVAV